MHCIAGHHAALAARRHGAPNAPGAAVIPRQRCLLFVAATGTPFDKKPNEPPPPDVARHNPGIYSPDSSAALPAAPDLPPDHIYYWLTDARIASAIVVWAARQVASQSPSAAFWNWLSRQRTGGALNEVQNDALLRDAKGTVTLAALAGAPADCQLPAGWLGKVEGLLAAGAKIEMPSGPKAGEDVPKVRQWWLRPRAILGATLLQWRLSNVLLLCA